MQRDEDLRAAIEAAVVEALQTALEGQLERLLEVVRALTTAPDLESYLQTIISEASGMTDNADREMTFVMFKKAMRTIADLLGISINTSKSQLILPKKRLRELLEAAKYPDIESASGAVDES